MQQPLQQPTSQYLVGFDDVTSFSNSRSQEHVAKNGMPFLIAGIQDIKDVLKNYIKRSIELFELFAKEHDSACWCLIYSSFQQVYKFRMVLM